MLQTALIILLATFLVLSFHYFRSNRISISLNVKIDKDITQEKPSQKKEQAFTAAGLIPSPGKTQIFAIESTDRPSQTKDTLSPKTLYDFETTSEGWEVPFWAMAKPDHVATTAQLSSTVSSTGHGSLAVSASFPGITWAAALAEVQHYIDLSSYGSISADIFIPTDAPSGLYAKLILTSGDTWNFIEMLRVTRLIPGKWTTVTASLSDKSIDWGKTTMTKDILADIRKIGIRVESPSSPYSGVFFIDNVLLSPEQN